MSRIKIDLTTLAGWQTIANGSHKLSIVAMADGYQDSDALTLEFVKEAKKLATPTNIIVNKILLTWDPVVNATDYSVIVGDLDFGTVTQPSIDLAQNPLWSTLPDADYLVQIIAKAPGFENSVPGTVTVVHDPYDYYEHPEAQSTLVLRKVPYRKEDTTLVVY